MRLALLFSLALTAGAAWAETPAEGQPLIAQRRDGAVAYWEAGDMAYALSGKADTPRLMALAERIAPAA